jgi:hypothetical protein
MTLIQKVNGRKLSIEIRLKSNPRLETLISTLDEIVAHIYSVTTSVERIERLN